VKTDTNHLPLVETACPTSEGELAEVVRRACAEGTPVYPIGGGTVLDYGGMPSEPGIGLSLVGLNRVIDYAADDMTITVEPGLTLAELRKTLAPRGQRLPVDAAEPLRMTIGGIAAMDLAGPRRYAFGTMRDHAIGLRAVDGQGTAFSTGGQVVKNAAGYNLGRLLVGSLGTLGIITQVTLLVRPQPETSAVVIAEMKSFDAVEQLLAALSKTRISPVALEVLAGPVADHWAALGPMRRGSVARVFIGLEGTGDEVAWMVETLRLQWRELPVASSTVISGDGAGPTSEWLLALPADVAIRILPGHTIGLMNQLLGQLTQVSLQADAGNGEIRLRLSERRPEAFARAVREVLRPTIEPCGGRMILLHPADECAALLGPRDLWGPPPAGHALMQAIKDRFDPQGILNPGRSIFANR